MNAIRTYLTGTTLTAVALCLLLISNIMGMNDARANLDQMIAQQQTTIERNDKVETQLEALATGTQKLADGGNANAQKVVGILQQNGINIKAK